MIAWGRSCAARTYGIIRGTQVKTNIAEFRADFHSVDCSGGSSKVLTDCNKIEVIKLSYLLAQGISLSAAYVIMQSWRTSTRVQYRSYIKK